MGGFNNSNWPQMSRTTKRNGKALTLRHQSIFSPRLINEATFGFTDFPERDELPIPSYAAISETNLDMRSASSSHLPTR